MNNKTNASRFLWNLTQILSMIFEIACWIALAAMIVLLVYTFISSKEIMTSQEIISQLHSGINIFGCQIGSTSTDPETVLQIIRLDAFMGLISAGLMAMTYRNTNLILKTCKGETSFSEGSTPFQKPVVRMIREIGIFLISMPVVQLIFAGAAFAMIDQAETSVSWTSAILGLLMICLSQCFNKGVELEKDAEGLI